MEDLSSKIEQFLSSPDSMEKITSALSAFTAASDAEGKATPSGDAVPAVASTPATKEPSLLDGLDMGMIMKLAPLLSGAGKEDKNTVLLKSLRPYFHGDREKKLDEALHIIRLINLLPLLQDGFPSLGK